MTVALASASFFLFRVVWYYEYIPQQGQLQVPPATPAPCKLSGPHSGGAGFSLCVPIIFLFLFSWGACLVLSNTRRGWANAPRWGERQRRWLAAPLPLPNYTWACVLCRPPPELPFHFVWGFHYRPAAQRAARPPPPKGNYYISRVRAEPASAAPRSRARKAPFFLFFWKFGVIFSKGSLEHAGRGEQTPRAASCSGDRGHEK
jgi:hypothetical protein